MNSIERLVVEKKPIECERCHGKVYFVGNGKFVCKSCGYENLDDFGKVRAFMQQYGDATPLFISQSTGVCIEIVELFLEQGRLNIPRDSSYYLECETCGCSIRSGRFCSFCVQEVAGSIKNMFMEERRARMRYDNPDMAGRMHLHGRI